jgi:hypothetical protein
MMAAGFPKPEGVEPSPLIVTKIISARMPKHPGFLCPEDSRNFPRLYVKSLSSSFISKNSGGVRFLATDQQVTPPELKFRIVG